MIPNPFGQPKSEATWPSAPTSKPQSYKALADIINSDEFGEAQVLGLGLDIARTLEVAAGKGTVHGSLSPSNILVTQTLSPVQIVWPGRARAVWAAGDADTLPPAAGYYVSPECVNGAVAESRSDIYSLGAILFNLIARRPPYPAETFQKALMRHLTAPLANIQQVVPGLNPKTAAVINRCLKREIDLRFQDYPSLIAELATAQEVCITLATKKSSLTNKLTKALTKRFGISSAA